MTAEAKARLRRELRAARRDFVTARPPVAAFADAPPALAALLARSNAVAVYIAMADEADPAAIASLARAAGCAICLPRVEPDGVMRFAAWDGSGDSLIPGQLAIPEPRADAPLISPELIVAPLLGFDRTMGRIGQGKGYYDRAFACHPNAFRLGLAWSIQEVADLPMDPWDVRLHAVLTEREWIGATS